MSFNFTDNIKMLGTNNDLQNKIVSLNDNVRSLMKDEIVTQPWITLNVEYDDIEKCYFVVFEYPYCGYSVQNKFMRYYSEKNGSEILLRIYNQMFLDHKHLNFVIGNVVDVDNGSIFTHFLTENGNINSFIGNNSKY